MPDQSQINVFVICTMTKRFLGTGNVLLREVGGASISERFSGWVTRVQQSHSPVLPAIDTYSGGHWSVVRSLSSSILTSQAPARLWIVSAGYGLISPADEIIPYGATFSPGQPDSISAGLASSAAESSEAWWGMLSQWRPPSFPIDAPRSVGDVISLTPGAANLLILTPDYFRALRSDLRQTLKIIPDPEKLIILTSDDRSPGELARNTIRIDARLRFHLVGPCSALGIKTARAVLTELEGKPVTVDSFRAALEDLVARYGVEEIYDRQPQADDQVISYIKEELTQSATQSASNLLRKFRDSGRACERKRFQKLFSSVKEQRSVSLFALNAESV